VYTILIKGVENEKIACVLFICVMVLMVSSIAFAQKKDAGMPGGVVVNVIAFEATVEAIDYQSEQLL
jgi:hypothetical protein